ncbi:hypothetical protein Tel_12085 [Candidatus Tenderia electrophaga]|jgi:hypothetical protein|uniref:Uncharacterized protein n=1 Tax=Candidatus Tenderia electrophaga TaxID=1748243 RepID=A0A0S2TFE0_9GAMM|nr:hypothetical protein Tel_12085 [Candidatus Tenderia electrophaga]
MTTKTLEDIRANDIETTDATLTITMPNEKLKVGQHTFQLEVKDDSGNVSAPAKVMLIVLDTQAPTAVITVNDEEGRPLDNNSIGFGRNFILNGKKSVDVGGGNIVSYNWSLVDG